jgi:chromosome segregation ATPase
MSRFIQIVNLVGVLALAALCASQWIQNRALNGLFNEAEKSRLALVEKLEQQGKELQAKVADLDDLRERVVRVNQELQETGEKLRVTDRRLVQLESERDQLKSSITNWVQAVAVRDEQLQKSGAQLNDLMTDRNQIVGKYNELAERHGKLVKDWNDQQARLAATNAGQKPSPTNSAGDK